MSRRHPKRRSASGERYAKVNLEVLQSSACVTLPNYAFRVLVAIAAQYSGSNNGDLAMTRTTAASFGITSQEQLIASLRQLQARGLIQKTRQGGKKPLGPTLYAITWQPIDDLNGKIESGATTAPSNAWAKWSTGLPADQSAKNHQVCRRTATGLPAVQKVPESGLPAEQNTRSIGTAGRPPLRVWPEGHAAAPVEVASSVSESPSRAPPITSGPISKLEPLDLESRKAGLRASGEKLTEAEIARIACGPSP